jgi:hypothetical protein
MLGSGSLFEICAMIGQMKEVRPKGSVPMPIERVLRNPVVQVIGIAFFTYLAARDAIGRSWVWFTVCLVFVAVGIINLILIGTGWRSPGWTKRQR